MIGSQQNLDPMFDSRRRDSGTSEKDNSAKRTSTDTGFVERVREDETCVKVEALLIQDAGCGW